MRSTLRGFMDFLSNSWKDWKRIWNPKDIASAPCIQANEVVTEGGNPAQNLNMGVVKMAAGNNKLVVTMDYINEDGVSAADVVATYKLLDYPGVVKLQGALIGSLQNLGEEAAATKTAAAAS